MNLLALGLIRRGMDENTRAPYLHNTNADVGQAYGLAQSSRIGGGLDEGHEEYKEHKGNPQGIHTK